MDRKTTTIKPGLYFWPVFWWFVILCLYRYARLHPTKRSAPPRKTEGDHVWRVVICVGLFVLEFL